MSKRFLVTVRGDGHGGFWCGGKHWEEGAHEFAERDLDPKMIKAIRNCSTRTNAKTLRIELLDREAPEEQLAVDRREKSRGRDAESDADRADRLLAESRRAREDANAEADRIKADANAEADARIREAKAEAERIKAEAEAEAAKNRAAANRARAEAEAELVKAKSTPADPKGGAAPPKGGAAPPKNPPGNG